MEKDRISGLPDSELQSEAGRHLQCLLALPARSQEAAAVNETLHLHLDELARRGFARQIGLTGI